MCIFERRIHRMFFALALCAIIGWFLFAFHGRWFSFLSVRKLLVGWVIKLVACSVFFLTYTFYYGEGKLSQDAGAFVEEARVLNSLFQQNKSEYLTVLLNLPGHEKIVYREFHSIPYCRFAPPNSTVNSTRNHIKLLSLGLLVFVDNIYILFVLMCLISYLGLLYLFRFLRSAWHIEEHYFWLFFAPSLLFWDSSILKETFSLFGICLMIPAFLTKFSSKTINKIALIGFVFTLLIKPYLFICLALSFIILPIIRYFRSRKKAFVALSIALLTVFAFTNTTNVFLKKISDKQFDFINDGMGGIHLKGDTCNYYLTHEQEHLLKRVGWVYVLTEDTEVRTMSFSKKKLDKTVRLTAFQDSIPIIYSLTGGESYFPITAIDYQWSNFLICLPEAFINSFFRPFPFEKGNFFLNIFFFLESFGFFVLLSYVIFQHTYWRKTHFYSIMGLLVFCLILSILIGLTTPISGAIVRYRIPVQMILIVAFLKTLQLKQNHAS